ncbi:MAG TPA: hypothetical protein ENK18_11970, partial [Deltaproteobacteria bacterium]|nr:hypothetical protein [Deltaproteobacteria bacterium]
MIVWLSAGAAASPGWSVQTGWISSGGPDHYGTLSVSAHTSPGTRVGALLVGGTRSAVLGSAARTLELEPGIGLDLGLWLGMIRTTSADRGGPLGGGEVALRLELQP